MKKQLDKVKLITDGGCRGNPGKGAISFMILDENNRVLAKKANVLVIQLITVQNT